MKAVKKIGSFILAVCLMLSLFPAERYLADGDTKVKVIAPANGVFTYTDETAETGKRYIAYVVEGTIDTAVGMNAEKLKTLTLRHIDQTTADADGLTFRIPVTGEENQTLFISGGTKGLVLAAYLDPKAVPGGESDPENTDPSENPEQPDKPEEPSKPEEPVIPEDAKEHSILVMSGAKATLSGKAVTSAKEGEIITISWTKKSDDYAFVKWTLNGAQPKSETSEVTTFTMGKTDVSVQYEETLSFTAPESLEELKAQSKPVDTETKVSKLTFPKTAVLIKNDGPTDVYRAKAEGENAPDVAYVTSNKDIVSVKQDGTFYPMGQGEASVTAFCGNKKAVCKVTVVSYTDAISIAGEAVEDGKLLMKGGEQAFLTVSFDPYDSTDPRGVTWKSDNKNVTVKNGIVTAKAVQTVVTATIMATVKKTDPTTKKTTDTAAAKVAVTVQPIEQIKAQSSDKSHSLSLKNKNVKLTTNGTGKTAQLEITLTAKAKDQTAANLSIISVTSTNTDVVEAGEPAALTADAKNSRKGTSSVMLTAKNAGTAWVAVKSSGAEGAFNCQLCKVTVTSPATKVFMKSGTLLINETNGKRTITMRKGESGTVEIALEPEFTTDFSKVKLTGSGAISVKNGIIYAKKETNTKRGNIPAKLTVKCGKLSETVEVNVVK